MTANLQPRRTRRKVALDERVEVRFYSSEKAKLSKEAKARGLSIADLIRSQLGDLMDAPPPEASETKNRTKPTPGPTSAPNPPEVAYTDLVGAMERAGIPHSLAVMKLRLGKVSVSGEPWHETEVPADRLAETTVDGVPLPVEAPGAGEPQGDQQGAPEDSEGDQDGPAE